MRNQTFADRHPVTLAIALLDCSIVFLAAQFAYWLRFGHWISQQHYLLIVAIVSLLVILFSTFGGLYDSWRGQPLRQLIKTLGLSWSPPFILALIGLVFTKRTEEFSRLWVGSWFLTTLTLGISFRLFYYLLLAVARANTRNIKTILIVGSKHQHTNIKHYFETKPTLGYRVRDYLPLESESQLTSEEEQNLLKYLNNDHPHEIWLCLPLTQASLVTPLLYSLRHSTADIRFVPHMEDMTLLNHQSRQIGNFLTIDLSCSPMDGSARFVKRLADLSIGGCIFILTLPICIVIAIAIKLTSPGPIFFKQYRDGLNGNKIKVYKFRSMTVHQEANGNVTQATKGDTRVTKLGQFLRRTSLDELPQFYNVLQGRMSIVGPRPHAIAHNEYYKDLVQSYMWRHKVKPGITGWAQVNGFRGETDTIEKMQARVELDLWYIDNWSLSLDIKIIILTIFKGFINKNAY